MEQRNNLVLQGTETFSRGALDNVALESAAVLQRQTVDLFIADFDDVVSRLSEKPCEPSP